MEESTMTTEPVETPLDSLKTLALVIQNQLDWALDCIAGSGCDTDHEEELDAISWIGAQVWKAVAEHVPGTELQTEPYFRVLRHSNTYSDGTPITEQIILDDGVTATYMPRVNGDRAQFVAKMNAASPPLPPALKIVED